MQRYAGAVCAVLPCVEGGCLEGSSAAAHTQATCAWVPSPPHHRGRPMRENRLDKGRALAVAQLPHELRGARRVLQQHAQRVQVARRLGGKDDGGGAAPAAPAQLRAVPQQQLHGVRVAGHGCQHERRVHFPGRRVHVQDPGLRGLEGPRQPTGLQRLPVVQPCVKRRAYVGRPSRGSTARTLSSSSTRRVHPQALAVWSAEKPSRAVPPAPSAPPLSIWHTNSGGPRCAMMRFSSGSPACSSDEVRSKEAALAVA